MVQVAEGRVRDIHALNMDFLTMVAESDAGENYGVSEEVTQYIKSLSKDAIERIASTDVLLFQAEEDVQQLAGNEQAERIALLERLNLVARDFAQAYPGLAECHLRMKPSKCKQLLMLGTSQIQEYSRASKEKLQIVPLAVKAFRMLASLNSPLERTQYVALACD